MNAALALTLGDRVSFNQNEGMIVRNRPRVPGYDIVDDAGYEYGAVPAEKVTLVARAQYASPGKFIVEIDDAEIEAIGAIRTGSTYYKDRLLVDDFLTRAKAAVA